MKAAHANVDAVTRQLTERSQLLKAKVDAGELAVISATYLRDTGHMEFLHTEGSSPLRPALNTLWDTASCTRCQG